MYKGSKHSCGREIVEKGQPLDIGSFEKPSRLEVAVQQVAVT